MKNLLKQLANAVVNGNALAGGVVVDDIAHELCDIEGHVPNEVLLSIWGEMLKVLQFNGYFGESFDEDDNQTLEECLTHIESNLADHYNMELGEEMPMKPIINAVYVPSNPYEDAVEIDIYNDPQAFEHLVGGKTTTATAKMANGRYVVIFNEDQESETLFPNKFIEGIGNINGDFLIVKYDEEENNFVMFDEYETDILCHRFSEFD